jgi:hypothetical protein
MKDQLYNFHLADLFMAFSSYLTAAFVIYGYVAGNRFIDVLFAAIAVFLLGNSLLLDALKAPKPAISLFFDSAIIFGSLAVLFLILRVGRGILNFLERISHEKPKKDK